MVANLSSVIASEAKQSILLQRKLDCFVAALLAMTVADDAANSVTADFPG
jgi:hypothetical protein